MKKAKKFLENSVRVAVVAIAVANYFLIYVINITLSRLLGAEDYGDYSVAVSVATLGFTLALLGKDKLTVKQLAIYLQLHQSAEARGFIVKNLQLILLTGAVLGLFLLGVYELIHSDFQIAHGHPIVFAFLLIPLMAVVDFCSKILIADQRVLTSMLLYKLTMPLLFMSGLVVIELSRGYLTEISALFAFTLASLIVLVIFLVLIRRDLLSRLGRESPMAYRREWLTESLPYFVNSLVLVAMQSTGIFFLELFRDPEGSVGVFAAVSHTASVLITFFTATSALFLPKLAPCIETRDWEQTRRVLRAAARTFSVIAAISGSILFLFGEEILLLFGDGYASGYGPLTVLVAANMVAVVFGMATPVLQYAGHHRSVLTAYIVHLLANLLLNALLVERFEVWGAAWALALPRIAVTIYLAFLVWREFGISVFPLGASRHRRTQDSPESSR
ncbi:MAG: hypothetical protein KatS3mg105_0467 [Gemmatales bacterium]|nr:MAG: hypothetical protein KatS3mg105_0467 [Gemmatales bacterium]